MASVQSEVNGTEACPVITCKTSVEENTVTIRFMDGSFVFHAQWLHDARFDNGPSKNALEAFCFDRRLARIKDAQALPNGPKTTVCLTWDNQNVSNVPALWLRAMAPLVALSYDSAIRSIPSIPQCWLPHTLEIPEIPYNEIFNTKNEDQLDNVKLRIIDALLSDNSNGIIKVVGLPEANLEEERERTNTLVTIVLKQIFGNVFAHPRRGNDKTFNVSSHHPEDVRRATALQNYDINKILLTHCDHAHYGYPAQIQGLYELEGLSENTFVSSLAVLHTMKAEAPDLYEEFCQAPMMVGRVAHYYDPTLYQGVVDTPVTMIPGFPGKVKRVRWHPHLTGYLVSPFGSYLRARAAYQKFQEIARRDSHLLRFVFKPGDMYLWNNHKMLHGRESVLETPRTSVGQTVPEQVVSEKYRELLTKKLIKTINENWLVQTPNQQLQDMLKMVDTL